MASDEQPGVLVMPALAEIENDEEHTWIVTAAGGGSVVASAMPAVPTVAEETALPIDPVPTAVEPATSEVQVAVARAHNDGADPEPQSSFDDVSHTRAKVEPKPTPFVRVRRLDVAC